MQSVVFWGCWVSRVEKWNLKDFAFWRSVTEQIQANSDRQVNLVGDEPGWVNEIRTIILFMKWRYEIHIWGVQLFPNNNFMDNKCKPWCDFTMNEICKDIYMKHTHTHIYIYTYFLCIYIYAHLCVVYICVCVCTHERSLYQRRLVRCETMLLPSLSSSHNSTLSFSFRSVPFLPPTWAGCLGSYSSLMGVLRDICLNFQVSFHLIASHVDHNSLE